MPERLDRVEFQVGLRPSPIAMPWKDRDELLDRTNRWPTLFDLRRRIAGAGASRPVELDRLEELDALLGVLGEWTMQLGSATPQSARSSGSQPASCSSPARF